MKARRQGLWGWQLGPMAALVLAQHTAGAAVDLAVTASADRLTVQPGVSGIDLVNFTIGLTNAGPDPADAVVTSALPAGLRIPAGLSPEPSMGTYDPASGRWDVGLLGEGGVATLLVPAQAVSGAAGCLVNAATAALAAGSGTTDTNPANDAARATVGAPACADLAVTSTRSNDTNLYCFDAKHTIQVTNRGPNPASNVRLLVTRYEITAPAGFSEPSCIGGSVTVPGPAVITLGTLTAGETRQFNTGLLDLQSTGPDITVAFAINAVATEPDPDAINSAASGSYVVDRSGVLGGDGEGTTCIISAMLGPTPFASLLPRLRDFRDRQLMARPAGRAVVAWYYRASPGLARQLDGHERLRGVLAWGVGLALAVIVGAAGQPVAAACAGLLALFALLARRRASQKAATDVPTVRPEPTRTGMPSRRR